MPNHVIHEVSFTGKAKRIKELLVFVRNVDEDTPFDFEKIIPMPESLRIESSSMVDQAMAVLTNDQEELRKMLGYNWVKEKGYTTTDDVKEHLMRNLTEADLEMGRKAINNIKEYGCKDWYDWSRRNWGTKWNCYDVVLEENNTIRFQTAWCTPYPVFAKLGEIFPDVTITVKFADEDIGSNCGTYEVFDNTLSEYEEPENPEQFARELWRYEDEDEDEDNFDDAVDNLLNEGKL
jgi:hypothetical protein